MNTVLTRASVVHRRADLLAQRMHDDLVMADLRSGNYYGLTGTGRAIWEAVAEPISVADLQDRLLTIYRVEQATCESELLEFLESLRQHGILLVKD